VVCKRRNPRRSVMANGKPLPPRLEFMHVGTWLTSATSRGMRNTTVTDSISKAGGLTGRGGLRAVRC
jgi:hypothetical protein